MASKKDFKWEEPTNEVIAKYQDKWKKNKPYPQREKGLDKLFQSIPLNDNLEDVLVKVAVLNDFYSTNIMSTYDVADNILKHNFDSKINKLDYSLVDDIANVKIKGSKKCFYSFATKYCSHHNPNTYPIFDKNVQRVLFEFNNKFHYTKKFTLKSLKSYKKFYEVINAFKDFYKLKCSYKELDRYLWQYGKEYDKSIKG